MPSKNKKMGKKLRSGFTTGTAAAAAAKSALVRVLTGQPAETVDVELLTGDIISIPVKTCCMAGDGSAVSTVMKDAVALWKRTSGQMWNICRANNITYLHLLQPNQYVAGSKVLSDWEKEHAWSPPNYWYRHGVEKGYPHLFTAGQELSKAGIPFFDITDSFRETRETIYKDTCCHYNGRGNQILAKRISQIIANHPDI